MNTQTRLIRRPEVERRVGLSRPSIYRRIADGTFPHPVRIGERAVAWIESEVDQWIADRISGGRAS